MTETKSILAHFHVRKETDTKKFQDAIRRIYSGDAEDEHVSYVLDNVVKVVCGHDPDTMRAVANARWSKGS